MTCPIMPLLAASAWAKDDIILKDSQDKYLIGKHLEILEDTAKNLTIEEISGKPFSGRFAKSKEDIPNFGLSDSAFWVRFTIRDESSGKTRWLIETGFPFLNNVDLYFKKRNEWVRIHYDETMPFHKREFKYPNLSFSLPKTRGEKVYYMRMEMKGAMVIPLTIWEKTEFHDEIRDIYFIFGGYYGLIIAIFFYNLLLFFSLRDLNYLIYIIYVLATGLVMLMDNGLAFQFLWPEAPEFNVISPVILDFNLAFWVLLFIKNFLQIKDFSKLLNKFFYFFICFSLIGILSAYFLPIPLALQLAWFMSLIIILIIFISCIVFIKSGYRLAKYFLFAWVMTFIGITVLLLRNAGIFPSNFFTNHSMQIGSAFELILLSMALGDRYNQFKEERDKFQSELNISRLQALQNRMSPHFLFNALNTIYSMMQAGYPLAKDAVLKLSEIYHFLTDNGLKKLIFLKEELFFLDSYLEIMKLRFQERIKISMDINGSFQNTLIPPLTIQPIVENCFKHGLKKGRAAKMDIRIIIKERDDGAEIIIENTGPEINLKKINSRTLENIRQRLIFNYSEAQIQTLNIKGSGVRVLVFYSKKKG